MKIKDFPVFLCWVVFLSFILSCALRQLLSKLSKLVNPDVSQGHWRPALALAVINQYLTRLSLHWLLHSNIKIMTEDW